MEMPDLSRGDSAATRKYVSPKREEQAKATRQAIREAAQQLFIRNSYGTTSIREIAEEAGVAVQTVRNYVAAVYDKLGVHSRAEAVVWARERGIVG